MGESVHWMYGVAGSEISHNFSYELSKDIVEAFGGEEVFLTATDSFFPDDWPEEVLSKRDSYLATGLTSDDVVAKVFADHKADIYRSIEISVNEYGDESIIDGVNGWFDIEESACKGIPDLIKTDTLEAHPELLLAVTRYVCVEFLRQVSLFLEYGRI